MQRVDTQKSRVSLGAALVVVLVAGLQCSAPASAVPLSKGDAQKAPPPVSSSEAAAANAASIGRAVADEGPAHRPPMGWNTWYAFRGDISAQKIKEIADAMVRSGMKAAGYEYVNLDHLWMAPTRDAEGSIRADPDKFPRGLEPVIDYVHSKGLKFGLYMQCRRGMAGTYGFMQKDAAQFAAWGVDFLKLDFCDEPALDLGPDFDKITVAEGDSFTASAEAEATANTLTGEARKVRCPGCSGGQRVVNVGRGRSALRFESISVPRAGTYRLTIDYTSEALKENAAARALPSRRAHLSVNGSEATPVDFPSSGGRGTTAQVTVDVQLEAGTNTIRFDNPVTARETVEKLYTQMRDALDEAYEAADREIVLQVCEWGANKPWLWAPDLKTDRVGVMWRTTFDNGDSWNRIMSVLDQQVGLGPYAGPGAWNYMDMVRAGGGQPFHRDQPGGMKSKEYRAQMSLWSILNSPLIASTDLRDLSDTTREILTNREVIAVNQDWAGTQGRKIRDDGDLEVWAKPMSDGSQAVVLLNRGGAGASIGVSAEELGLPKAWAYVVRDLWRHDQFRSAGTVSELVDGHSAAMLRVSPAAGAEDPNASGGKEAGSLNKEGAPALSWNVDAPVYFYPPGEVQRVTVTVINNGRSTVQQVRPYVKAPAGWTVRAAAPQGSPSKRTPRRLAPGESMRMDYAIAPPPDAKAGSHSLSLGFAPLRGAGSARVDEFSVVVPPPPPGGKAFLSDMAWTHMHSGRGLPVTLDHRLGRNAPSIKVGGKTYEKGLGTQAWSDVRYYLGGACTRFSADIGIDDAVEDGGSVTFQVWGDGKKLYESGVMTGRMGPESISVDVSGTDELQLVVTNGGDEKYQWIAIRRFSQKPDYQSYQDWGDWADARVTCNSAR